MRLNKRHKERIKKNKIKDNRKKNVRHLCFLFAWRLIKSDDRNTDEISANLFLFKVKKNTQVNK